ncbi:Lrp/AsnC family transcriptional regulator [Gryllotalpicola sp.]|uniref:Lrp/AsnC family transcriptional regulator n=1 Tax=Gryllotalpicola sp. TaxID=1932787 RepID=UPI0026189782|nr:Lrp/AsnC family transcriptional regulator [Gryllotalpicola sp.]
MNDTDLRLIELLAADGRMANAEFASRLGIAASTCHARLRSLVDRGIISGFHASVDHHSLGRGLQAIIGVTLRPGSRQSSITAFAESVRRLPQVLQLFFVGGVDDFLVHIAVADSSQTREFVVEHLSAQHSVASTRTSIIFEYHRNTVSASFE